MNEDFRFLPRWQQLQETAFAYADRARVAPNAAARDHLTGLALSHWRASRDAKSPALLDAKGRNCDLLQRVKNNGRTQ